MQSIRGYVRSTVAEVLHDVCMDVLVAPPQRNFDKRRMNRFAPFFVRLWRFVCLPMGFSRETRAGLAY